MRIGFAGVVTKLVVSAVVVTTQIVAAMAGTPTAFADGYPTRPLVVPMLPGPPQTSRGPATAYIESHPGSAPFGANDFDCRPSAAHPYPVILVHGTDANAYGDWAALSPLLVADGYCVFALNYGGAVGAHNYGTEDMIASGGEIADFTGRVLSATGAAKVDFVGYSQGATVSRYFVNRLGGAAVVNRWIGVASPTYGGVMYGLAPLILAFPGGGSVIEKLTSVAVRQQIQGSDYLDALNAGGDTVSGVKYTTIGTRYDEVIQPYTNVALKSPGAVNILLQSRCPQDASGHFRLVYDPFVLDLVRAELDPTSVPVGRCQFVPLGAGIPQVVIASNS